MQKCTLHNGSLIKGYRCAKPLDTALHNGSDSRQERPAVVARIGGERAVMMVLAAHPQPMSPLSTGHFQAVPEPLCKATKCKPALANTIWAAGVRGTPLGRIATRDRQGVGGDSSQNTQAQTRKCPVRISGAKVWSALNYFAGV